MALIAIIISLVVERFLGFMEELRRYTSFHAFVRWLVPRLADKPLFDGPVGVLLLCSPLLLVALIDHYLWQWWFMLGLAFSVLVLLYSFGPKDLEAEVEAYIEAQERGDEESACWHAATLIGEDVPEHSVLLNRRIIENILVEANERMLAVLFWFLLLGPVGALLYRLVSQMTLHFKGEEAGTLGEAAYRLHAILAWLPARMCALIYALAGSFVESLHAWRTLEGEWHEKSRQLLIASGLGALGYESGEEAGLQEHDTSMVDETLSLVRRAVLVFLGAVALFTLAGWMG